MLPVYKAVLFHSKLERGGSTQPWIVFVNNGTSLVPFVVKLYTEKSIAQYHAVTNEVLGNLLAQEFDLNVPKPALIEFDKDFIKSLPDEMTEELKTKDARIKFGCEYLDGSVPFTPSLHRNLLAKYYIETIYAFDNLILNVDRRFGPQSNNLKPNILFLEKDCYLIDHELSFSVNNQTIEDLKNNYWTFNYKNHIFYQYLKKGIKQEKYFETFEHYLIRLNVNVIDSYLEQLKSFKHPINKSSLIKSYLEYIKGNSSKFITLLKGGLL